jgi:hypothetical protein
MNWKTRQLFSDREHGIVSGLSPVNMAGGGNVPYPSSYQEGGTVGRAIKLPYNPLDRAEPIKLPYNPLDRAEKVLFEGAMAGGPLKKGEQPFDAGITQEELDLHTTHYDVSQDTAALEEFEALSIEQRVAALAAQQGISVPAARAMILNQMLEQQGVTLSEEVINQFAVGLITLHDALSQAVDVGPGEDAPFEAASWKEIWEGDINEPMYDKNILGKMARYPISAVTTPMQKGMGELAELLNIDPINPRLGKQAGTGPGEAMAIDLFQQGDEDINEPLNMMAQATNPSIADITPAETVEETVTVTEDQGPTDTENSKSPFRKLAIQVVVDANKLLIQEDYMNIEEVEQQVKENLTIIDEQYRLQTGADDTILTPEFLDQLDQMMRNAGDEFDTAPGMKDGGTVWDFIGGLQGKGVAPAKIEEIIKKYYNPEEASEALKMLKDRQQIARRGALLGGKTKQGGWAGMMDILGQADAAEAAAIGSMPETLATNEAALKRLAMSGELETSGAISSKMPVDVQKMLITQNLWEDTTMEPGLRTVLLEAVAGIETQEAAMQEFKNKLADNLLGQDWNDLRSNELKGYREKYPDLSPQELIIIFAEDMTNLSFGVVKRKG